MKRKLTARVWKEDDAYIAQCLELEIASQGETEEDALEMLKEALELYLSEPFPGEIPSDVTIGGFLAL